MKKKTIACALLLAILPDALLAQSPQANVERAQRLCATLEKWVTEVPHTRPLYATAGDRTDIAYRVLELVQDEYFIPYFGSAYDKLSTADFTFIAYAAAPPCLDGTNYFWFAGAGAGREKSAVKGVFNEANRQNNSLMLAKARLAAAEFATLMPQIEPARSGPDAQKALEELRLKGEELARRAPGSAARHFAEQFAAADVGVGFPIERDRLTKLLASVESPGALSNLQDEEQRLRQQIARLPESSRKPWRELDQTLKTGIEQLILRFAVREAAALDEFLRGPKGADPLKQAVADDLKFSSDYRQLLTRPEYAAIREKRNAYRLQQVTVQTPALAAQIATLKNPDAVDAILVDHLIESDKNASEAQALLAAANQRYDILMPFRHLGGGVYLSAIYRKDLKAVEDGDAFYVSGVRSAFSQLTGIGAVMAQWANRVAREQSGGKARDVFDSVSMIGPVMAVYLLNYQDLSARCLKPNHQVLTITRTYPDQVTVNGWGVEVARRYGQTTVTRYKVNPEFVAAFQQIGTAQPEDTAVGDALFNGGKITELLDGTREMMKQFRCDDPRIVQMEKNLLATLAARRSGASR